MVGHAQLTAFPGGLCMQGSVVLFGSVIPLLSSCIVGVQFIPFHCVNIPIQQETHCIMTSPVLL